MISPVISPLNSPCATAPGETSVEHRHPGPRQLLRAHRRAPLQADRPRGRQPGTPRNSTSARSAASSSTPSTVIWPGGRTRPATARISYDILGRPALDQCEIRVETIRPGRTIELIEAVVLIADRPVVRARAWLLATVDTSAVAGGPGDRLTPPHALTPWPMASLWPGGYIASLDVRPLAPPRAGRTTAWISTPHALVADEPSSTLAPTSPSSTPPTASPYDSRPPPGCTPTSTHGPPPPPTRWPLDRPGHHGHLRPHRPRPHQHRPARPQRPGRTRTTASSPSAPYRTGDHGRRLLAHTGGPWSEGLSETRGGSGAGRLLVDLEYRHHPLVLVVEDVTVQDRLARIVEEPDPDDHVSAWRDVDGVRKP